MSWKKALESYSELPTWGKCLVVGIGAPLGAVIGFAAAPIVGAAASGAGLGVLGGMLSGAAASSAGLAALGGGAIIAGGAGVAGGTAIVAASSAAIVTATAGVVSYVASSAGEESVQEKQDARSKKIDPNNIRFE